MLFQIASPKLFDLVDDDAGQSVSSGALLITAGAVFMAILVIGILSGAVEELANRVSGDITGASW